jgi:hypothetical protein
MLSLVKSSVISYLAPWNYCFLSHGVPKSDNSDLDQEKEMKDTSFAGGV